MTTDTVYDAGLLETIDFAKDHRIKYDPPLSLKNPGPNLIVRPLQRGDVDKGYLELLTALTDIGDVSKEQFQEQFNIMAASPRSYFITVIEDTSTKKIIGSGTLHVEYKFYKKCGLRGRIEDVCVLESYRRKQLGKLIVEVSTLLAKKVGCFRVSLHCFAHYMPFYSEQGFYTDEKENLMWLKDSYLE